MATDDLHEQLAEALRSEPRQPPPDRIAALRVLAEDRRDRSRAPTPLPSRRTLVLRRVAAGLVAACLAVGGFVVGTVVTKEPAPPDRPGVPEFEVALSAPDGTATAVVDGRLLGIGRLVRLQTDVLPILPKGEYYEIWFVGPGDRPGAPNRISAGTFHPDDEGRSDVEVTAAVDPKKYPELAVTAEPGDGNPAPTGPEVLRGPIQLLG